MKVVLVPGPRNEELIAEILRNKAMLNEEDWWGYVYDLVADHAKSRDISYESAADDDQTQPTNITPDSIASAYWRNYCTDYATRANRAICAVLLLGEYMQRKEPSFRTDAFLLGLNAMPMMPLDIINKITNLCGELGISLPIMPEYISST